MTSITEHFPYLGLFIILILGETGLPFPEGIILMGSGFLIYSGAMKPVEALPVAYISAFSGDLLSYWLGRRYGHSITNLKLFRAILPPARLSALEKKLAEKGTLLVVVVGRILSGTFIMAGILGVPFKKVAAFDAVSAALAVVIWSAIGYLGANSLEGIERDVTRLEHWAVLAGMAVLGIYLLYQNLKKK
jgi:membrane protein DedA with SNARE-associated domain